MLAESGEANRWLRTRSMCPLRNIKLIYETQTQMSHSGSSIPGYVYMHIHTYLAACACVYFDLGSSLGRITS